MIEGMKVDDLIRLPGRGPDDAVKEPTVTWKDEVMSVVYHYEDCDVPIEYDGKVYRVAGVEWKSSS